MKNFNANEYLKKVLHEWKRFCESHGTFERAIIEILTENETLKLELENAKNETYKEFADKLKKEAYGVSGIEYTMRVDVEDIDNLLEELTERKEN